jgi:hypothetical protein
LEKPWKFGFFGAEFHSIIPPAGGAWGVEKNNEKTLVV